MLTSHLVSDSKVTLKWFCESCDKSVMDKGSPIGQKEKLDQLLSVMANIDTRIKQLEDKLGSLDNQLDDQISAVEGHMKPLHAATTNKKENAISDEELLKCAIQEEINRKAEKEKDLEKGRKTLLFIGFQKRKRITYQTEKAAIKSL